MRERRSSISLAKKNASRVRSANACLEFPTVLTSPASGSNMHTALMLKTPSNGSRNLVPMANSGSRANNCCAT